MTLGFSLLSSSIAQPSLAADSDVRLSSAGFLPARAKRVTVRGQVGDFVVRDAETDDEVLSGPVQAGGTGADALSVVDISALEEGRYYVEFEGHGRGIEFSVAENVYDDALLLSLVGFYGWRSGVDVSFMHQGVTFSHEKGHLDDGLLDYVGSPGETRDGTGGWYDAGDYGKYVVNGAFAAGQLLTAWEHFEENLTRVKLPIPESGGDLPDFLAEVRVELEWLLKMQMSEGDDVGAVYDKLTPTSFEGFVLPAEDTKERFFVPHSSTATASFAAVTAKGARVMRPFDGDFADELEARARLAWDWLAQHPDHLPPDVSAFSTGNYDSDDVDERLWAAAELFETTGEAEFLTAAESAISSRGSTVDIGWDWPNVGNMGVYTYALSEREERDPAIVDEVVGALGRTARQLSSRGTANFYGRTESFYWGSNGSTLRACMTLQVAHRLEPTESFLDTCTDQLGYVFGRNEYNRSHLTGFGIDPPLRPHHRLSGSDDVALPYPGLLVGGGDKEGSWSDEQNSYSTNEVAINWNAALVYALAGFASEESLEYDGEEGGTAGAIPGPPPPPPPPVIDWIDDLEDGDLEILKNDDRSGAWYTSSDNTGDAVSLENSAASPQEGDHSVRASGSGYTSWGAGLGFTLREASEGPEPYDASAYTGFTFWVRANEGVGERMRVLVRDTQTDPLGGTCTDCYDHFMVTVELSDEWQQVHVRFSDVRQQGFGDSVPSLSTTELLGIEFQTPANVSLDVQLDSIGFVDENSVSSGEEPVNVSQLEVDEGGCGCKTAGKSRGARPWELALLFGACVIAFARRRHATS